MCSRLIPSLRHRLLLLISFVCLAGPAGGSESGPAEKASGPLEPNEAVSTMRVPEGFRVELVAAEPLVVDPVAFDWGPDGRLWVAEMIDYPNGLDWHGTGDPLHTPGGRIKVLTDTDGDGRYDEATVFLEGLSYPTGVKVWKEGVLVTAAPEIFYAADTDGDGKADQRETWYSGFAESNQQHRVNGLAWGLDNWLHVANGDGGGVILSQERREEVDIRGFDLRIDPVTKRHEPLNGRTQCGRVSDDWGNWFGCNNSNPLWHYPYPWHLLRRNPEVTLARAYVDVPVEPGAAPVYPISPAVERFNDFDRANRFTSACGPAIYRDVALGEGFAGNAFICEPVHNLVSRQVLRPRGGTFSSERHADERASEFFASTDPWSRPVSVRTGPDGALWIADMYRLVIEHPEWIPQAWQKKLELRAGSDRGRIYRVVAVDSPARVPRLAGLDDAALVARLESDNGTVRDLVHQMLLWRGTGAVEELKALAVGGTRPLARVHALAVLDGLDQLDVATLRRTLSDPHRGVVRHAIRLSDGRIPGGKLGDFPDAVLDDAFVAVELAGRLGESPGDGVRIAGLMARHHRDPVVLPVLLSAVNRINLEGLVRELTCSSVEDRADDALPALGRMAAKWGDAPSLALIAGLLADGEGVPSSLRMALFSGLFEGGATLDRLTHHEATRVALGKRITEIRSAASDLSRPESERAAAIRFLGHPAVFEEGTDLEVLAGLLGPQSPPLLREAVFEAFARARPPAVPALLTDRWPNLAPSDRSRTLSLLLGRADGTATLLDAIETGAIARSEIDAASRTRLLDDKDEALKARSGQLFADSADANRAAVIEAHADVLSLEGDPVAGKVAFGMVCVACHVAEGQGSDVGPDLAALTDRSPGSMLTAILDPNRAIEDKYLNYTLTLANGDTVYGLIADETANSMTLRLADGTARTLPRHEVVAMASNGVSLMPEGFERILTKTQLADLLAYLGGLGSATPPPPKGNIDMAARISPGKGGVVELRASRCRLDGERIEYMPEYDAIGWWTSEKDRAQWTLVLDRPGKYRVEWEYSVSPEAAGNGWIIEIAGKEVLSGTVASTGSWETFKTETLGTVDLPAADNHVVVRSKGAVKGALLDLRVVRFVPVEE